ncbi:uncharacterized protein IUM83_02682 [Phytophthora cinnamomi]|uniref:uncharacterized protein n=1 Tax=Phytophthora cinnamomi TaxID=4785 RepID=UPI0035596BBD|nr:hypothetical protein IUM83_02682 [Phytophthora cinnamomi]
MATAADSSQATEPRAKKRKPTYLVRTEEETALRDEVERLEARVNALKAGDQQQRNAETQMLLDIVRNEQLGVAAAQSLMMEFSRTRYPHPLYSRICLKKDWSERRAALLAIWDEKLQNAYNHVTARSLHMAGGADLESNEKFETEDGDICFVGVAVIHFPGVQSLRQVFEALYFYLNNMEISISERLGHITVREDYDIIEGSAFNSLITSSDDNGIATESNTIALMQLFEHGDPRFGGEPCAIVASDCVDEDERYPYRSSDHVRKDISGAILLTACRQKAPGASTDSDEVVVTMRRTGLIRLHRP